MSQILEVDLVTADGSMVTTNELGTTIIPMDGSKPHTTKNADLFWALKGGGGSTWYNSRLKQSIFSKKRSVLF